MMMSGSSVSSASSPIRSGSAYYAAMSQVAQDNQKAFLLSGSSTWKGIWGSSYYEQVHGLFGFEDSNPEKLAKQKTALKTLLDQVTWDSKGNPVPKNGKKLEGLVAEAISGDFSKTGLQLDQLKDPNGNLIKDPKEQLKILKKMQSELNTVDKAQYSKLTATASDIGDPDKDVKADLLSSFIGSLATKKKLSKTEADELKAAESMKQEYGNATTVIDHLTQSPAFKGGSETLNQLKGKLADASNPEDQAQVVMEHIADFIDDKVDTKFFSWDDSGTQLRKLLESGRTGDKTYEEAKALAELQIRFFGLNIKTDDSGIDEKLAVQEYKALGLSGEGSSSHETSSDSHTSSTTSTSESHDASESETSTASTESCSVDGTEDCDTVEDLGSSAGRAAFLMNSDRMKHLKDQLFADIANGKLDSMLDLSGKTEEDIKKKGGTAEARKALKEELNKSLDSHLKADADGIKVTTNSNRAKGIAALVSYYTNNNDGKADSKETTYAWAEYAFRNLAASKEAEDAEAGEDGFVDVKNASVAYTSTSVEKGMEARKKSFSQQLLNDMPALWESKGGNIRSLNEIFREVYTKSAKSDADLTTLVEETKKRLELVAANVKKDEPSDEDKAFVRRLRQVLAYGQLKEGKKEAGLNTQRKTRLEGAVHNLLSDEVIEQTQESTVTEGSL